MTRAEIVECSKSAEFAAEVAQVKFEIVEPGEIVEGKRKATGAAGKGAKGAKR